MPASGTPEPEGTGPVIHDNRRIDPVTGPARRGKHAASKPAGTTGAGRPGGSEETGDPMKDGKNAGGGTSTTTGANPDMGGTSANAAGTSASAAGTSASAAGTSAAAGATSAPAGAGPVSVGEADRDAARAGSSGASDGPAGPVGSADPASTAKIVELTSDLQRVQAEYANYRKRVDRDRASVKEQAVAATLAGLLPVLDAIDQAREHGELSGGFKSVADQLQAAVSRLGLITYGEKGDPFDPKIHEALIHSYSADVSEDTCVEILQPGYKVGDRILRAARVAVAEPATGPDGASNEASWPSPDEEGN
jgi:molecular chaperone GrpE